MENKCHLYLTGETVEIYSVYNGERRLKKIDIHRALKARRAKETSTQPTKQACLNDQQNKDQQRQHEIFTKSYSRLKIMESHNHTPPEETRLIEEEINNTMPFIDLRLNHNTK